MCRTCLTELLQTASKVGSTQEVFLKWIMQGSGQTDVFSILSCKNCSSAEVTQWQEAQGFFQAVLESHTCGTLYSLLL